MFVCIFNVKLDVSCKAPPDTRQSMVDKLCHMKIPETVITSTIVANIMTVTVETTTTNMITLANRTVPNNQYGQ